MSQFSNLKSLIFVAALILFGVSTSSASPVPIQDNGAFFSDSAKSEAARNITELEKAVKKGVVVQTFKELPADVKLGLNLADKTAVDQAVSGLALKRARLSGVNGVYILLVRTPSRLQVEVGNDTQRRAFTLRDRNTLVSTMTAKLRAKQYDEALLDGVNFVASTMRANMPVRNDRISPATVIQSPRQPQGSSLGWLKPLIIGVIILWAVMAVFRMIFRSAGGGGVGPGGMMSPMGGGMGGGGGGGFFSSLLGGMFGGAAGSWLYDQFSGNRGSSTWGGDRDSRDIRDNQNSGDQGGYSGQDTDFSGSGDSFGDDSGGGNSGGGDSGGDSGGGDSGGGDSGGGGDF